MGPLRWHAGRTALEVERPGDADQSWVGLAAGLVSVNCSGVGLGAGGQPRLGSSAGCWLGVQFSQSTVIVTALAPISRVK